MNGERSTQNRMSLAGAVRARAGRIAGVAVVTSILVLAPVAPAEAHDPLFLTEDQTTPERGPLLPDGTISFALYGEISGEGDSRGLQVRFEDGDQLFVELLVPDSAPENALRDAELPSATVTGPHGVEIVIGPPVRGSFFEPFTATSYLRLGSVSETAVAGVYDILITGPAPARFTLAVGNRETFGTPVERVENRVASFDDLERALGDWLETPPSSPLAIGEGVLEPASDPAVTSTSAGGTPPAAATAPAPVAATTTTVAAQPGEAVVTAPAAAPASDEAGVLWVVLLVVGSILLTFAGIVAAIRRGAGPR